MITTDESRGGVSAKPVGVSGNFVGRVQATRVTLHGTQGFWKLYGQSPGEIRQAALHAYGKFAMGQACCNSLDDKRDESSSLAIRSLAEDFLSIVP